MKRKPRIGSVVCYSADLVAEGTDPKMVGLVVDVEASPEGMGRYRIRWADEPGRDFGQYLRSDIELLCW